MLTTLPVPYIVKSPYKNVDPLTYKFLPIPTPPPTVNAPPFVQLVAFVVLLNKIWLLADTGNSVITPVLMPCPVSTLKPTLLLPTKNDAVRFCDGDPTWSEAPWKSLLLNNAI